MKKQPPFFKRAFYVVPVIVLLFVPALFNSCSKTKTAATPDKITSVQLGTDAVLGNFLTDNKGNTLYYFSNDIDGVSKCTGGCLALWPVFYDSLLSASTLGAGLTATDFAVITTSTGAKQTTYKGWPLYYYAPPNTSGVNVRESPGQKGGEKIGNIWFVVKTDYSIMLANKKVGESGTTDSTVKEFLTDSAGHTLYYFVKDSLNPTTLPANCTGNCALTWLAFYTPATTLPSLLNKTDFGSITRTDGAGGTNRPQSTYKGRPLYYNVNDASVRGSTKGEGVGKLWFVTNPDVLKIN